MLGRGSNVQIEIDGYRFRTTVDPRLMPVKTKYFPGGGKLFIPKKVKRTLTVKDSTIPRPPEYGPVREWHSEDHGDFFTLHRHLFRPRTEGDSNHVFIREFTRACQDLDKTEAGHRARALLFSFLNEDQLRDVEHHNRFDVVLTHPRFAREVTASRGRDLPAVRFRIHRGFPIMNVNLFPDAYRSEVGYSLCIQPQEPYPTDDICLVQLVALLTDPDDFLSTAVWQMGSIPLGEGYFRRLWLKDDKPRSTKALSFPYIRELAYSGKWKPRRRDEVLAYIDHVLDFAN